MTCAAAADPGPAGPRLASGADFRHRTGHRPEEIDATMADMIAGFARGRTIADLRVA
jgi:hypothetical protein